MILKDFPYIDIYPLAETESWRKEIFRPIYYGHKWWARRLGSVFRYIIGTSLIDHFTPENYSSSIKTPDETILLDPFMGSGTTLGESLKFGCKTIGSDINPVSYFMVKTSLQNISIKQLEKCFDKIKHEANLRVSEFYKTANPKTGSACDVLYYFWVAKITCPDCKEEVPLFDTFIFSKNAYPSKVTKCQIVCPRCFSVGTGNYLEHQFTCPKCRYSFDPHKGNTSRNQAKCLKCDSEFKIQKVVKETNKPWEYKLYAVMYIDEFGEKQYKAVDKTDINLFNKAKQTFKNISEPLIPNESITPGNNTDQILNYNFKEWRQLFNERQLLTLHTLLELILKQEQPYKDILIMLFSGILEFNNMFCSFKGEGTGAVRHIFSNHILKPERMALENIVIGNGRSSGTFSSLFKSRILKLFEYIEDPFEINIINNKAIKKSLKEPIAINQTDSFDNLKNGKANLMLLCKDSSSLPIPDKTVDLVVTDPPFFDFINYSELADFFYSWIKVAKNEKPYLDKTTRSDNEVQGENSETFINKLSKIYAECNRVLKDKGLFIFTFHHSTDEGWRSISKAITESNFTVIKTYPVKSEMSVSATKSNNGKPINFDAVIVCKKTNVVNIKPTKTISLEQEVEEIRKSYEKIGVTLGVGDMYVLTSMKKLERGLLT